MFCADIVVPVDVVPQTITTVALDPINDVIYYATMDTFGIHSVNFDGEPQKFLRLATKKTPNVSDGSYVRMPWTVETCLALYIYKYIPYNTLFRRSLILRISRIWNRSRKFIQLKFEPLCCQAHGQHASTKFLQQIASKQLCVVLAPPSVLGVWSMALVLWLPFEC